MHGAGLSLWLHHDEWQDSLLVEGIAPTLGGELRKLAQAIPIGRRPRAASLPDPTKPFQQHLRPHFNTQDKRNASITIARKESSAAAVDRPI
jgi:hypothetical protein